MPYRALCALAILLAACDHPTGRDGGAQGPGIYGQGAALAGRGYVHYHPYPDTGVCACSAAYPFTIHAKMIAAASPAIHAWFGNDLCTHPTWAVITSRSSGKRVRVRIVDEGGTATPPFDRLEQHVMDLSIEAFDALDSAGAGKFAGRIYVDWEMERE